MNINDVLLSTVSGCLRVGISSAPVVAQMFASIIRVAQEPWWREASIDQIIVEGFERTARLVATPHHATQPSAAALDEARVLCSIVISCNNVSHALTAVCLEFRALAQSGVEMPIGSLEADIVANAINHLNEFVNE